MSTRGAVGFHFGGVDKIAYNHWDSYPSGLGHSVLDYLKDKTLNELKDEFEDINLISEHNEYGWNGIGFNHEFQDASDFLRDSLFCEYAYIINLDDKALEFYTGFNRDKEANGRYVFCDNPTKLSDGSLLYGVAIKQEIPLNEVFEGKWKVNAEDDGFVKL